MAIGRGFPSLRRLAQASSCSATTVPVPAPAFIWRSRQRLFSTDSGVNEEILEKKLKQAPLFPLQKNLHLLPEEIARKAPPAGFDWMWCTSNSSALLVPEGWFAFSQEIEDFWVLFSILKNQHL